MRIAQIVPSLEERHGGPSKSVRFLADTVGADHVLLGSDYPFPLGDAAPAGTVRSAGLDGAATAAVLGGNASLLADLREQRVQGQEEVQDAPAREDHQDRAIGRP